MKRLYIVPILLLVWSYAPCQDNTTRVSQKITSKMKDTLLLTNDEGERIFRINVLLHNKKQALRSIYSGDSLRIYMQRIENTRDSLYRSAILENKYRIYKEKKQILISNH
jgi:hypothetical protein